MFILSKSRFYAVVRLLTLRVNCGFYLVRIVAINLIVLLHPVCSFFLFKAIVPYLCIVAFGHSLSNWPCAANTELNGTALSVYQGRVFLS
jgi:hypothetical protein